ncbi:MAG: tyrosine decarboxylase MfnA, partial [Candidatus Lokiarchaeota archaeon]|nr:tyrosine decarboxylase MfnA [Candidatus Lokiarchaeota archaeon]MBD3339182.1 tyrosine decarboxylase MfnA [Candidatus Lokiarchaeota archaeon]
HQNPSKDEILEFLEQKLSIDYTYDSGSILGSMCTEPHKFGKKIFMKYASKNLGDPGLFPGTANLEKKLVSEIGRLFNGENIIGSITTGGSEANIVAMRIAKKLRPEIARPEIIVPASAHMSFDKGADLMGVKLRKAKLKDNYELDLHHFRSLINKNTCGVVGIAGTTSLGLIDPIEKIGEMIENEDIFFHIDAAFGGFVLPFLEKVNNNIPVWDFRVDSVDSITADPHKMGLGLIPSGGYFIRETRSFLEKIAFEIPYLAGGNFKHLHLVGTRSGATVISFWAILKYLGRSGYEKIVRRCIENTEYLVKRVSEIKGVKLAVDPPMNIVGITTENGDSICLIDEELRKRDWMLGKFEIFNLIRVVIMPHVTQKHLSLFADDLEDIVKKVIR